MARAKEKAKDTKRTKGEQLPVVPLYDVAPLPGLVIPVFLSRPGSLEAVNLALELQSDVLLSLYKADSDEDIDLKSLSRMGGIGRVLQTVRLSNGDVQVNFHVLERARVERYSSEGELIRASCKRFPTNFVIMLGEDDEAKLQEVKEQMHVLSQYDSSVAEHLDTIKNFFDPGALADLIGSLLPLDASEAQKILEQQNASKRLTMVQGFVNRHVASFTIKEHISQSAQQKMRGEQRQELLREQLRLIQEELGEGDGHEEELDDLSKQLRKSKMPEDIRKEAEKQLRRLAQLHPDTSEAALQRTYLDWILDLPWTARTSDRLDLKLAQEILDSDHFGLQKTKDRILDFLSVRKLKATSRGPILLLAGPPGVGKTSLGRSVAKALNRKFVRISVGGLRDEAELRGHRRTYVGALPGRIIQALKTAGSRNPVFILDEIDKIGADFRGDPAAVLLEILDPEQNQGFEDHYLNLPFDLSEVMFICTANITDSIPAALLDRMEVLEISGYTDEEKLEIAKTYLIPQEQEENGVGGLEISLGEKGIFHIIHGYTRESGVRELRRAIGTVFRKIAREVAEGRKPPQSISPKLIQKFLGPVRYVPDKRTEREEVGVVNGLAWTPVGGEILPLEISLTAGKGTLSLTGQLGEVMRESAMAALTFVLSQAEELGFDPEVYERSNVHVHVPQGAIPKDGPSAGIAIATALVSVFTSTPVSHRVAMTGEITLRGHVLAVGGVKEKALAAKRAGVTTVIIPRANERELSELPKNLRSSIRFVGVEHLNQVLELALVRPGRKAAETPSRAKRAVVASRVRS